MFKIGESVVATDNYIVGRCDKYGYLKQETETILTKGNVYVIVGISHDRGFYIVSGDNRSIESFGVLWFVKNTLINRLWLKSEI